MGITRRERASLRVVAARAILHSVMTFTSHQAYFDTAEPEARRRLKAIAAKVAALVPQATPCISYSMPAFRDGHVFFYFAAFKKHIGVYPPVRDDHALIRELERYRGPKGNLSFPSGETLPIALIGRVARALHREYCGAPRGKQASKTLKPVRTKSGQKGLETATKKVGK